MMEPTRRIATALACAALDPGLRGVLLFGLQPAVLPGLGTWLVGLLHGPTPLLLDGSSDDERLWTRLESVPAGLAVRPGGLASDGPGQVVLVADLAQLSPIERRAAIVTLDGDVAHLERYGLSLTWTPRSRWLAACDRTAATRLSPHLLDRFALRVDATDLASDKLPNPPQAWLQALAEPQSVQLSTEALDHVLGRSTGIRRGLALARLARALAALRLATTVEPEDVAASAELMGLYVNSTWRGLPRPPGEEDSAATDVGPAERTRAAGSKTAISQSEPERLPLLDTDFGGALRTPYPEDEGAAEREPGSLRPEPVARVGGPGRGPRIGVRPAQDVRDLAVTATVLEAARYQALRCDGHWASDHPLHISPLDLRSYRRAGQPGRLLVLLLDHTAKNGWDWYPALAPHLLWAYTRRAAVCVVEVGAAEPRNETRAERFVTTGLLDPRVAQALERPSGRSTPLAHGLDLAIETIRRRLHLGLLSTDNVLFIVATDGRGNVPIAASVAGTPPRFAGSAGVTDALRIARGFHALKHVPTVVIDPGPRANAYLTVRLAEALGARLGPAARPGVG
ncbi:hypothetical protein [Actinomadura geliboluensis]